MHVHQCHFEAGLVFVLLVQRHLDQGRALAQEVDIAGHHFQVDHFDVILLGRDDLVDVGQLLALGVHFEVVRVALPGQHAGVAGGLLPIQGYRPG